MRPCPECGYAPPRFTCGETVWLVDELGWQEAVVVSATTYGHIGIWGYTVEIPGYGKIPCWESDLTPRRDAPRLVAVGGEAV